MKQLLVLVLSICFVFGTAHAGRGGDVVGNGGDAVADDFIFQANKILQVFKGARKSLFTPEDIDIFRQFEDAIVMTKVSSVTTDLIVGGVVVDAINYSSPMRIVVNRNRWFRLTGVELSNLVLHEYLGAMKYDDSKYSISQKLLGKVKALIDFKMSTQAVIMYSLTNLSINVSNLKEYSTLKKGQSPADYERKFCYAYGKFQGSADQVIHYLLDHPAKELNFKKSAAEPLTAELVHLYSVVKDRCSEKFEDLNISNSLDKIESALVKFKASLNEF